MRDILMQPLVYWQAGGWLMIPLAFVCLALWTLFFRARREIEAALKMPGDCDREVERAVRHADPRAAAERLARFPEPLRAALASAADAFRNGDSPREEFERQAGYAHGRLSRDLAVLRALTTLAPLLGLLGTVVGMIATFRAVADTAGDTSAQVAGGISQALITTQFGLAIAIPGVWGLARLRRALRRLRVLFGRCQAHLTLACDRVGTNNGAGFGAEP
jgi:biopolymer transport protein ExbB